MRSLGLISCISLSLAVACSDDGLAPAQGSGVGSDSALPGSTGGIDSQGPDGTGTGAAGTLGEMDGGTDDVDGTTSSPPDPTTGPSGDSETGVSSSTDTGTTGTTGTTGDASTGTTGTTGTTDTGSSSDGGMMAVCPDIAGTTLIGGPADLYGYCWYLTAPMDTCDSACSELAGGANLALLAESSYPDSCMGPVAGDVSTWFFDNGNPGGWTGVGGATSGHTLGYGYSMVGTYYGKCSSGPTSVGTYPGEMVGGGLETERQLVCACAEGTP